MNNKKNKNEIKIGGLVLDKIKIGKVFNVITTVIFIAWMLVILLVMPVLSMPQFLITTFVLTALFAVSCLISNYCLKDYKPDKKLPEK
ncbi:MAG: hypothetical protein IKN54_05715 [Lachnospiraceae bacterium]|nr:hypothetical protein [Lachnospiraceae bacterium]